MKIYLGADHGGYELKEKIKAWLTSAKYDYHDVGAHALEPGDDYPMYALLVAQAVGANDDPGLPWVKRDKGILFCRSAAGMAMAANKVPGVRAAAAFDAAGVKFNREHDDVNVLCVSGNWVQEQAALEIAQVWLETEFSGAQRHARRLAQISEIEKSFCGGCCGDDCSTC